MSQKRGWKKKKKLEKTGVDTAGKIRQIGSSSGFLPFLLPSGRNWQTGGEKKATEGEGGGEEANCLEIL